ncbi:von Willebrand factor A domain-containing protein 7-like [Lampris incognitus]|uniref:von Willebrand factor A domain-containing protein 7-like n=1 Tax=Lampris incognitus TaxID=2546036 RepID=UPI0024B513D1|nr:von Willebrand factor A domain-containing protein 7-like [Lampris incognitus]
MTSGLAVLCVLLLQGGALGFGILPGKSLNHPKITERAVFNATVQVCRNLALAAGTGFTFPSQPWTAEAVAVACGSPSSSKTFRQAVKTIKWRNIRVDIRHPLNSSFHFDEEHFTQGRKIITDGLSVVKASNKQENYEAARQKLGEILHPLQDFYSHSNWVELGNKMPNSNLIKSGTSIGNTADLNRATCRNCDGDDCRNNILDDILKEKILTTGYFGLVPFFSTKPKGKCSHGGKLDQTSRIEPKGGINKDSQTSSHGHLHFDAANVAIAATRELLEDVQAAAGDIEFLQMMGISKGSNKALCIVIDTTGSMADEIAAVKAVTSFIIDSKVGTEDEPSVYILVPFNDPDFGPLIRTTDPEVFKTRINALSEHGGGDFAEMSLSALQLALTGAPPSSEIFLFTDATAKDKHLKSTVTALIERTKTVVNFMLTNVLGLRRWKEGEKNQSYSHTRRTEDQLYRELAQASGGQAIEVAKNELSQAVSIITKSSSSSLVTVLQLVRNPGTAEKFFFSIEESMRDLTIYITGRSLTFALVSPSGVTQISTEKTGSLGTIQSVGNFITIQLSTQTGMWGIKMESANPYTLKVIGQSGTDFLFDFVEVSKGPFSGYEVLEARPRAGVNGSLLVSLTGSAEATVTEVSLVEVAGSGEVTGTIESLEDGDFLVHVDPIPSVEFVVRLKGQVTVMTSATTFQRQSSTSFRASSLSVTADADDIIVPGTPFSVPFTVMTNGTGGNFSIRATNDRSFDSTFPTSLMVPGVGSANGTVTLTAPLNTPSGSDVTLTIEAEAPGATDTNYVVMRISIVNTVTDFVQPTCRLVSLQSRCPGNCASSTWELSVNLSDGAEGTGIGRVSLKQGNGTLNTSAAVAANGENITLVSYSASCCSPSVELMVVDGVGNVGSCFFTLRATTTTDSPQVENTVTPAALSAATKAHWSSLIPVLTLMAVTQTLGAFIPTELGMH